MDNDSLSFARKYRPATLNKYIGNDDMKRTLMSYLRVKKPHVILLTGSSGCGKTTMARLIAKEYLCSNRNDETGACDECVNCQLMNEYIRTGNNESLPDIYEVDATEQSGKRNVDAMLEGMAYPPSYGDYKVYIIDECHMLSEAAQNRLLKSIEEPEEWTLIILCTTNPEKLLETIVNRCQLRLQVTKPTTQDIISLLREVCGTEGKEYDTAGLRILAARSDNVIRDSLNNLERVIATQGKATSDAVSKEFKAVSDNLIFDFYKAYLNRDFMSYIRVLYNIKTTYGFAQFILTLTQFTTRGIYIINGIDVDGMSEEELSEYAKLFKQISPQELGYILGILKRINVGDVEANLMAFIYRNDKINDSDTLSIQRNGKDFKESEQHFRNNNLQRLENVKLDKGSQAIAEEMKEVSFFDFADSFNLEKVE